MLDRADCADFGCHNSIRLETKHFLNTLALTFISFSGRFVFAMQKHYLFFLRSTVRVILRWVVYGWRNQCILVGQDSAHGQITSNIPKFWTCWVSLQSSHANFQNIFVSPNIADIFNFFIFCKTQKCLYLENRAR